MMQNLKSLTSSLTPQKITGSTDIVIKGIAFDSRLVKKGYLYIAVVGLTNDGHNFINEALKNGALAVIGENDINPNGKFTYFQVRDTKECLGIVASRWFNEPSSKLKVIGVTGTKGKTTTVHILYHLLKNLGKKTGMVSSIAAKIGNEEIDTGFHVTNPDAIALNGFLRKMVDSGLEYAVIEVSSHGIAQKRIAGVKFEAGILTNIAPEHLDYHKSFKEYKNVKMSFINSCKIKIISPNKTELNILPGYFNNLNAHAAMQALIALGFEKNKIINALSTFKLPEGRLEQIDTRKGFKVVIDFAHTPESLKAALIYLRSQSNGKIISVFGCAGERDPFKRPKMGKISAELADVTILTAEDPRSENILNIISQIKKGIKKAKTEIYEIPDRETAIKKAISLAVPGDIVGIFGKGHEKSMNLDGKTESPWSDQETVRKYIKEAAI